MRTYWLHVMRVAALISLFCVMPGNYNAEAAKPKPAKVSCKTCHADFAAVVPKTHPLVKGNDLASCLSCHKPDMSAMGKKNVFSTKMHLAHLPPKGSVDCLTCHKWSPGKSFGLINQKESWGAPTKEDMDLLKEIFNSWASSGYTDNLHAKASISCFNCHGKGLPKAESTLTNQQCLACHGPMDQLALKTEPKEFKDRNPHKSHLGEIACTVCHKGHQESKVYCLGCHQKFDMKIKGTGAGK